MSPSPEDQAMQQLQSQQSRLLDKIDELRAVGVGGLVELPQLIVCGNQSSGKSSVLEAISRVRFPAKSSFGTRFATEVILRRSTQPKFKVSIEPGASRTNEAERQKLRNFATQGFSSYRDLPRIIEQATECMGIGDEETANSGFSDDVLKVAISGPDQPELTLVDLPGLYTSTSHAQGAKGIEIVRGLTEKYMKSTRTIILAVISAKTDYHLQGVLNMAERFDSKRQRTIGIITQPDILEAGSEEESNYLQFMRNEKINLRLGWHALRNRSFETREMSDDSRDEMERTFFEQGRWASLSRDCVGVDSLRRRLSSVLLQHIRRNLPGLITEIQDKIADHQQRLARLGPARSTLQQQRGFLLAISSGFERITRQALSGMYADEFFTELGDDTQDSQDFRRLRAVIRELNECFAHAMNIRGSRRILVDMLKQNYDLQLEKDKMYMEDWSPEYITREALEEEIGEQARKNRGIELPGSANQLLVSSLFRDQSKPWEGIARVHLLHTWESVKYFVLLLLGHLADEPTYTRLVDTVFAPQLERLKDRLLNKLEELTAYTKRGQLFPIGDSFLSKIRVARTTRHLAALRKALGLPRSIFVRNGDPESFNAHDVALAASKLESSSDEFAVAEIIDQMEAYYDTTIVTFVDNIATLGIENCLLWPLEQIFTIQTVNSMEDQQIRELAEEPPHIQHDRQRLSQELNRLQAGLNTFNIFHAGGCALRPPSIFVKPAVAQPALFQSPDAIALRGKCKPNSKTPSAPTKRSPSPPVVADNNRNRNTTACSTRNQGSLFGIPSVSTENAASAPVVSDNASSRNTTASSTHNQGSLFGTPSISIENAASPPVVSENSSSKNTTASSRGNAFPLFAPPPGPTLTGNSGTGNDSNSTNAKMKKSGFGQPIVLGGDSARTSAGLFGSSSAKADAAKPSTGTGPGFFGRPSSSQPTGGFSFVGFSGTPTKNDSREAPATEGPRR